MLICVCLCSFLPLCTATSEWLSFSFQCFLHKCHRGFILSFCAPHINRIARFKSGYWRKWGCCTKRGQQKKSWVSDCKLGWYYKIVLCIFVVLFMLVNLYNQSCFQIINVKLLMWLCFPFFRSDFDDGDEGNKLFRYICLSLFCQYAQRGSIWLDWGGCDNKQCFVRFSSGAMMKL